MTKHVPRRGPLWGLVALLVGGLWASLSPGLAEDLPGGEGDRIAALGRLAAELDAPVVAPLGDWQAGAVLEGPAKERLASVAKLAGGRVDRINGILVVVRPARSPDRSAAKPSLGSLLDGLLSDVPDAVVAKLARGSLLGPKLMPADFSSGLRSVYPPAFTGPSVPVLEMRRDQIPVELERRLGRPATPDEIGEADALAVQQSRLLAAARRLTWEPAISVGGYLMMRVYPPGGRGLAERIVLPFGAASTPMWDAVREDPDGFLSTLGLPQDEVQRLYGQRLESLASGKEASHGR